MVKKPSLESWRRAAMTTHLEKWGTAKLRGDELLHFSLALASLPPVLPLVPIRLPSIPLILFSTYPSARLRNLGSWV